MSRTIHSVNSKVYLSSNGISNFFKPHAAPKGLRVSNGCEELCLKSRFRWKPVSCLVRVTSWIVPFVQKTKDDPRSHTNRHEPKTLRPQARSDLLKQSRCEVYRHFTPSGVKTSCALSERARL